MRCEIKNSSGAVDHECVCKRLTKSCELYQTQVKAPLSMNEIIDKAFEIDEPPTPKKRGR